MESITQIYQISLSLLVIGVCVYWTLRLVYSFRRATSSDAIRDALSITAGIMITAGICGILVITLNVLSIFAIPLVIVIGVYTVVQFRKNERYTLIWAIGAAARAGIPISAIARALASEQFGDATLRNKKFADFVEAGVPLASAFELAKIRLPTQPLMAVRIANETGELSQLLTPEVTTTTMSNRASIYGQTSYLVAVLMIFTSLITFLMVKIIPVFKRMFDEFGLRLPEISRLVISACDEFVKFWPLVFLPILAVAVIQVIGVFGPDWLLLKVVSPIAYLKASLERVHILKFMSTLLRRQINVVDATALLSRTHPNSGFRKKLHAAYILMRQGVAWPLALRKSTLISGLELDLLVAAERVGNVPWAMNELAEQRKLKATYRVKIWNEVLLPITIVGFAFLVLAFALTVMMPLASLITGLSR